jgi:N utilization substance protein B
VSEFASDADMPRADAAYFEALVAAICGSHDELDAALAPLLDRKPAELDPVEHALLLIGSYELQHRLEVPFRVVINEAVNLARRFGATDGHKFVNGVLDRAARLWRIQEH